MQARWYLATALGLLALGLMLARAGRSVPQPKAAVSAPRSVHSGPHGSLELEAVGAGRQLAVRWIVHGVPPTTDPELVGAGDTVASRNVAYARAGRGAVLLPPGRYRAFVTRGPEYTLPVHDVVVLAGKTTRVTASLERVVDTSGYLAGDFHVHAQPSYDSDVPLVDRVLALAAEGIELAAATDHDHVTDYGPALAARQLSRELFALTGVEISTSSYGHFNAFPYPTTSPLPPSASAAPRELFDWVRRHAAQAVLQVNHPRLPPVGYFDLAEMDAERALAQAPWFSFEFDALEVVNGMQLEDPRVFERNLAEWFALLEAGRRYTAVGNSDSHDLAYQWAGWPRTYVRSDATPESVTSEDVTRALKGGHALVSCGMFVLPRLGAALPGDTFRGDRGSLHVEVRTPPWIAVSEIVVYSSGRVVHRRALDAEQRSSPQAFDIQLSFERDGWLVAVARGDSFLRDALPGKWIKPFGFSNPIFVDVPNL